MERIGVRELRQHASRWLARVAAGEELEITDRGRPVARLVPVPAAPRLDRLLAQGLATPADGRLSDAEPPLPPPAGGSLSSALAQGRADER